MKILSMSGFVPEQICDTVRFTQYAGDRNIKHYCGYVSDFVSKVLQDESIDGAVYPKSCDSTRIMTSYLSDSGKFLHQIGVASYDSAGAAEYFANEIKRYKEAVEAYYGVSLEDIKERSELINNRNASIHETYKNLADMSFSHYLKAIHNLLELPLTNQRWDFQRESNNSSGKKVFVVGSFLANLDIIDVIEKSGLSIVGDTLPESGRLVSRKPVDVTSDIYMEIAHSILAARLSPTQNAFRRIIEDDFDEISKKGAKGIVFLTQKYCEPYDFLYAIYKAEADQRKIPIIQVSMNNTQDDGKAALLIEAFSDTI